MKIRSRPVPGLPPLSQADREQLAESIQEHGVLVPLLVCHDGTIIDGEERWRIIQEQCIKTYPIRVFGRMTEEQRQQMAYKVNLERRHLTRSERQRLIVAYIEASPEASTRTIAEDLGVPHRTAARAKARCAVGTPVRGRDGKTYQRRPAATSAESIHGARLAGKLLGDLPDGAIEGGVSSRRIRKAVFEASLAKYSSGATPSSKDYRLIHGDFRTSGIKSSSVDICLGDPPWGPSFDDDLEDYLGENFRVLKPGGLFACYVGVLQMPLIFRAAEQAGLRYWWQVAAINPTTHTATRVEGLVRGMHRNILIFAKPGKVSKGRGWLGDVIQVDPQPKHYHPWEQPLAESVTLLNLSQPGWLVADLTAGSGTSACAAIGMGCRWIGCELDKQTFRIASRRIHQELKARGKVELAPAMVRA